MDSSNISSNRVVDGDAIVETDYTMAGANNLEAVVEGTVLTIKAVKTLQ